MLRLLKERVRSRTCSNCFIRTQSFSSTTNSPSTPDSPGEADSVSVKRFIPVDVFSVEQPPRPFGFSSKHFDQFLKARSPTDPSFEHEILKSLLTEFPVAFLHKRYNIPLMNKSTDIPSLAELDQGAAYSFAWLITNFAQACKDLLIGKAPIKFRDSKLSHLLHPQIAMCLDEQLDHYKLMGVAPKFEVQNISTRFHMANWYPQHFEISDLQGKPGMDLYHLALPVISYIKAQFYQTPLQSIFKLRPETSRVHLTFTIDFEEKLEWFRIAKTDSARAISTEVNPKSNSNNSRPLTLEELDEMGIDSPDPAKLGQWNDRSVEMSLIADATTPLKFKISNLNRVCAGGLDFLNVLRPFERL